MSLAVGPLSSGGIFVKYVMDSEMETVSTRPLYGGKNYSDFQGLAWEEKYKSQILLLFHI